jgi:monoamine oxidase
MSAKLASSASAHVDVAVIGAGVAGLAAAAKLRRAGRTVVVLEAGHRIGGRAWTDSPSQLGGHTPFDHGASWLHDAHHNPLVPLARAHGEHVEPDIGWEDRVHIFGEAGGPASLEDYQQAEEHWSKVVTAALDGPDQSLAAAAAPVADDPWTATIESWEGAIIAAADADVLSLRDWHRNALEGENFIAADGIGAMLARCLGAEAGPVILGASAIRIEAEPGGIRIGTAEGQTLRAGAVIVTVSTGVLRAETIAFSPALPREIVGALDGLPMGLLSKIVVPAATEDRLGLSPGTDVFRRVPQRGAPCLSTIFWPQQTNIAIGFIGGRAAWSLCENPADAADLFMAEIAATLGPAACAAFKPANTLMTAWGTDPAFRGAYAYATPGRAGARATLNTPLWDNRLHFAGEACDTDGLAGTVGGAYLSGQRAAQKLLHGFPRGNISV